MCNQALHLNAYIHTHLKASAAPARVASQKSRQPPEQQWRQPRRACRECGDRVERRKSQAARSPPQRGLRPPPACFLQRALRFDGSAVSFTYGSMAKSTARFFKPVAERASATRYDCDRWAAMSGSSVVYCKNGAFENPFLLRELLKAVHTDPFAPGGASVM